MPTAVITESSEKTRSSSRICVMTPAKEAVPAARSTSFRVGSFQAMVDFVRAFADQKQPTRQQDQIAPGKRPPRERKQRRGQAHDPGDAEQEHDASGHGQSESEQPGLALLVLRQAAGQDRDEHDVVDAQHDLQRGQRGQRRPGFGTGHPVEHGTICRMTSAFLQK